MRADEQTGESGFRSAARRGAGGDGRGDQRGTGERLAVQRHVLHVAGLLDRREVLPCHLHAGRCEPPEFHLARPFPLDLAALFANAAASVRPLAVSRYF